ncbi:MAG: hypothetical protein ACREUD_04545 [Gammaproteobacteria bacterium]
MIQEPAPGQRTPKREFKGPVAWLLGQELLAEFKAITLYAAHGNKLDARDWMRAECVKRFRDAEGAEFWFDYIADTGDGQKAVYNIAYLCQGDLWLPQAGSPPGAEIVSLQEQDNGYRLPRGRFLLVGGDTAYHTADYATLADRFRMPFNWAYEDRCSGGATPLRSCIYGIPGNHDYYDALDGFNRQFLQPIAESASAAPECAMQLHDQLDLKGFERDQKASYVALELPFGWMLWALDMHDGTLDKRQQAFFLSTCEAGAAPEKMIVATPEPVVQFGKYTYPSAKIVEAYKSLSLEPCFLEEHAGRLVGDRCQLDISGDIHHYARYWGTGSAQEPVAAASVHDRPNYAALVAGGGGAFLHASHTDVGQVPHARVYPARPDSHNLMLTRLLNPLTIFNGGYIYVAGAVLAMTVYFAATVPDSSWSAFEWLTRIADAQRPLGTAKCAANPESLLERIQWALRTPCEATPGTVFPLLDLLFATVLLGVLLYLAFEIKTNASKLAGAGDEEWHNTRLRWFALTLIWLIAPLGFGAFSQLGGTPPAFLASFLVFMYIGVFSVGLVLCRAVSDVLTARKKHVEGLQDISPARDHGVWHALEAYLPFALIAASFSTVSFGVWRFGVYNASVLFTDIMTLLVLGLAIAHFMGSAFFVAGALYETKDRGRFLRLGAWHAFVQLAVPFVLIAYCEWWEIVSMILLIGSITAFARHFFRTDGEFTYTDQAACARKLSIAWLAAGLVPFLAVLMLHWGDPAQPVDLLRIVSAAVIGALLSCFWFGWYWAVALAFNGHNNEAGGGARADRFRHLVRIKITRDTLTGYVIGIDEPVESFADNPRFRLVDVFTISCPQTGSLISKERPA